ncbi:16S rRNA (uracil(1498)-N(3))-methyltransferase [Thermomonas sp.]|jgi:16S rRNA (uracil1498-N3)-methyltransferase|uniref:16S rRNA (uracil(1498)-N(3))-methyltransferase n=1 Tax=Thermomonas sp. TaxID=1971895 RepID=UPI001ACB7637|nr:16S rRNA (uracil(1498)-N(3))-methyltransferase [Xanthomonadales bacterium]MBN8768520.1 16S rRNA (uracil(1498)-N(3))-methyltransferase [Stenotrophomonas sp.]
MRLTRCHIVQPLAPGSEIALPEDVSAHLLRVLRLSPGDACVLFNGDGHDYDARLLVADKRGARAEILAARPVANESPLRITLLQGIARGEKMDFILQKATELGVARVLPVESERSEVRLPAARAEKRLAHWRQVVVSACEQSGRATVPEVLPPQPLASAAAQREGRGFLLDPQADASLAALRGAPLAACTLAIGPEGGWSPRDRAQLDAAGFNGLRLGPRVLRTETAGLAAIAALQALAGDLG